MTPEDSWVFLLILIWIMAAISGIRHSRREHRRKVQEEKLRGTQPRIRVQRPHLEDE